MPAPRLRFKQFEGLGDWEEKPLSHYLHEHKLKSDGESEVYSVSVHKGVINQVEHLGRSFAASDTSKYNLARPFDIIYTKSPTGDFPYGIVKQNLSGSKVIVSPLYGVFEPKNQHVGYLIHAYFEEAARANNYLSPLIQKGAKNTIQISNERFATGYFYLPSNEAEQTHIAACLSSLDAVIDAHTDRLDALRQHKRALMQQLFPHEGERVPRLRFPEFEGAGEWEEKKLGDLGITLGGLTGKAGDDFGSGKPFVTYKQIFDYSTVDFYKCGLVKIQEGERQNTLRLGDVLITMSSETPEEVGYASVIREEPREDTYLNSFSFAFRANEDVNLNIDFSRHLFHSSPYRKAVIFLAQGVTRFNISKNRFLDLKLPLPPTLPEQTHIAACLSSLDDLISAQADKVAGLREFKRGLMQGLFPSTTNHEAAE